MNLNVTINVNVEGGATTNPSDGLVMSVQEAQANGFTFGIYEDGVEITGFSNPLSMFLHKSVTLWF